METINGIDLLFGIIGFLFARIIYKEKEKDD